jgi:6-phosphogluconolactonase
MSEAPPPAVTERLFPNADEWAATLVSEIAERLGAAVKARGVASMVVTGGTTPGPLYDRLSKVALPWERVFITLSDERWVATAENASNEHLVRTRLLQGRAATARFVPLKTADATAAEAQAAVGAAINRLPRPFDIVLLGMGDDGHVASLFPDAPETTKASDLENPALVCAVDRHGAAGADARMSLTFRALRDTRWTVVLITGDDKLATARRAQTGTDITQLPVRGVLNAPTAPVDIWWTA